MKFLIQPLSPTVLKHKVLILRGFVVEQFLLSPMDLGVPNTRVRYYCLASRQNAEGEGEVAAIKKTLPQDPSTAAGHPEGRGLRPLREFLVRQSRI